MPTTYTVAGIMSGTSLDGLDIAICNFENINDKWSFEVLAATTCPYTSDWQHRLSEAFNTNGESLSKLHSDFGKYIGQQVKKFVADTGITPHVVSSHGHTVFHQPSNRFTLQIGCGATIAIETGIDTVCDFRTTDVALGGQGAPLVPVGDQILFGGHRFCLNLGGIANISFERDNKRIAFDICPVNLALNFLSNKLGKPFDQNGEAAFKGTVIPELLDALNSLSFYQLIHPKSLGREWFNSEFLTLIDSNNYSAEDRLRTVCEHIGVQIAAALFLSPGTTMLTTGGGAFNGFLLEVIEEHVSRHGIHVVIPDETIVQFKEAIVFAFLGTLRMQNRVNVLSSVTGASSDSIGGCVYKSC